MGRGSGWTPSGTVARASLELGSVLLWTPCESQWVMAGVGGSLDLAVIAGSWGAAVVVPTRHDGAGAAQLQLEPLVAFWWPLCLSMLHGRYDVLAPFSSF